MPYPFPLQLSGDHSGQECSECGSTNTIFEEYIKPNTGDESELGIRCQNCDHTEDPDEYGQRFEPEEEE